MKVTRLDNGELYLAVPEAHNVSSALAEGRTTGHPLLFQLPHSDAVKLALQIAVIPPPGPKPDFVVVPTELLDSLVEAAEAGHQAIAELDAGGEVEWVQRAITSTRELLPSD